MGRRRRGELVLSTNCCCAWDNAPVLVKGKIYAMRVLVVEDDYKIASFVINGLKQAGFNMKHAADGEEGLRLILTEPYDAAVVDLMLPQMDGLTLIEELRRQNVNTPVIILSAKRSVDDRVKGLQAGGDDYMVKPVAFSELLARVQAL